MSDEREFKATYTGTETYLFRFQGDTGGIGKEYRVEPGEVLECNAAEFLRLKLSEHGHLFDYELPSYAREEVTENE